MLAFFDGLSSKDILVRFAARRVLRVGRSTGCDRVIIGVVAGADGTVTGDAGRCSPHAARLGHDSARSRLGDIISMKPLRVRLYPSELDARREAVVPASIGCVDVQGQFRPSTHQLRCARGRIRRICTT